MLISKFNRMIRNKFLWGFFAIVICLFFVVGSLELGGCSRNAGDSVGTIDGEEISRTELNKARLFALGLRSQGRLSESELEELEKAAWKRLATLRYAEKLGVSCTQQEIDSIVGGDPRFHTDGAFDPQKYEAIIRQELGVTTEIMEEYMAQEIVLSRIQMLSAAMILTPPSELATKLERLTDIVDVDYAFVTNAIDITKVKVSKDEVKEYFEENIDLFRVPEKMNVRYALFPIADYTSKVSVTEQDALDYYETNISDYSSRDTNDVLVTVAFTNVQEEIAAALAWDEATYLAKDDATEFVMALMPDRDGTASSLENVLKERGITMQTSPFFSMFENVEGVDAGYDFNRSAFALVPADPERSISDAVVGTSNVYVMVAGEKIESRLPELEEVESEVEAFAKRRKASKLFDDEAQALRNKILEDTAKGKSFREVVEGEDIEVITSPPFSVYSDMTNEVEYSEVLVPSVISLDKGETSELIPTSDGYVLVHVKGRQPGDLLSAELLKPQLISAVSRYRSSILFDEMQNDLFESMVVIRDETPAGDDEESEEESADLPAETGQL